MNRVEVLHLFNAVKINFGHVYNFASKASEKQHRHACLYMHHYQPKKTLIKSLLQRLLFFSHILIGMTRHFSITLLNFRNKVDTTHTEPPSLLPPPFHPYPLSHKFSSVVHIAS